MAVQSHDSNPRPEAGPSHRLDRVLVGVFLVCWAAFLAGILGRYVGLVEPRAAWVPAALILLGLGAAAYFLSRGEAAETHPAETWLGRQVARLSADFDELTGRRRNLAIALAACLGLFAELAMIRVHGSYFQLFAYFKNVSLISCFLGLGLGYARAHRGPAAVLLALPLLALQILFLMSGKGLEGSGLLQNPVPEQLSLGMVSAANVETFAVVFGFLGVVFAWNTLCFIPLGHLAGRLMLGSDRLRAYGFNLLGSLAGILLFQLVSFLWAPPAAWFFLVAVMVLPFLRGVAAVVPTFLATAVVLTLWSLEPLGSFDVYSPYQKITVQVRRDQAPELEVSNVYYQKMLDLRPEKVERSEKLEMPARYYGLPYAFKPDPGKVLVLGSGTGNDVAAALRHGAERVDAVEIDPVILELGRRFHPEAPYSSERVAVHVDDARSYLRRTDRRYDLIVFGLLDSHTLLANMSSVRLDGFVYTVESLRQTRQLLEPGGLISLTFSVGNERLGKKLFLMLEEAFDGQRPLLFESRYDGGLTAIIGDEPVRGRPPAAAEFRDRTAHYAETAIPADPATDDWPFFYMPVRKYPLSYVAMVLFLTALAMIFVLRLVPASRQGFSWPCFFLGAGFLLFETKGVTELALVWGSTWVVIGAVITAILIMAYLANAVVQSGKAPPRVWSYVLLIASIPAGLLITSLDLGFLPAWGERGVFTVALTLPLFFSGLAFSGELRAGVGVAEAMSANLLGAMLGGFLEYNSMYFGYRSLSFLAMLLYAAAFLTAFRSGRSGISR